MRVFVTGANGFMGGHLCDRLLKDGHEVRALILKGTDPGDLARKGARVFEGDIMNPDSYRTHMKGVRLVYHLAGAVSDWGPRAWFLSINADGTRNLLYESLAARVKRFVFMSSLAVHRFRGYYDANEDAPRDTTNHPYGVSKIRAEDHVTEFHRAFGLGTTIIRPGVTILGPNDRLVFPSLVRALEKGQYGYVKGGKSRLCFSYIENLIDGILLAGTRDEAIGKTYVVTDDVTLTWRELTETICRYTNAPLPKLSVPFIAAYGAAAAMEAAYALARRRQGPPLTRYRISLVARDFHFRPDRIKKELGYQPKIGFTEGVQRTAEWFLRTRED